MSQAVAAVGGGGSGPSAAEQRDQAGEQRDQAGEQRDQAGEQRDQAAEQRDQAGEQRDQAGEQRDQAAEQRDQAGEQRDQAAEQRDQAAEQRDQAADQSEAWVSAGVTTDALNRSALARREAASDRRRASQDRRAGASERTQAELDRDTALADRGAGASERTQAELDRDTALADRGAGASERTQAELDRDTAVADRGALAHQTERHESLLAAVSDLGDGLVVTHGREVAYVNDAYCAITGFTVAEVISAGIPLDVAAAEPPRSIESAPATLSGEPDHFETTVMAKDGHPVDVEISRRRQGTGSFVQTTAIVRDISKLRRAEARFRGLLEAAPDGFVGIDAAGRVVLINEAAEQLFAASREQLLNAQVDTLLCSADGPGGLRDAARAESVDGAQRRLERTIVRPDGTEVPVEVTVSSMDTRGGDQIVLASVRDVSERLRAARELLRRAVDLERSNAALEEFAYAASHDLQEPLRMVASYLQLLQNRYQGNLDSDADDFIGFAVDGARRMQALINDLLSYSRVGTQAAPMEEVALSAILEMAAANLHASIEDTGATIVTGDLPTIVANRSQLVQLCQNLVGNAIKFHGGRVPEVHIDARRGKGEWVITVRDNGIGIEPRHADRIFMIFKRLHPASEYPGTGIGLSICRKIVERHGGRIWIDSVPGSGSSFHFALPDGKMEQGSQTHERRESPFAPLRDRRRSERIAR
jgi:PAS domain S-box-containing protein